MTNCSDCGTKIQSRSKRCRTCHQKYRSTLGNLYVNKAYRKNTRSNLSKYYQRAKKRGYTTRPMYESENSGKHSIAWNQIYTQKQLYDAYKKMGR